MSFDREQAVARLTEWSDSFTLSRFHLPQYANPGELKADIRGVLALLAAAEETLREREELLQAFVDHIEDIGRPGHLARQDALLDRFAALSSGLPEKTPSDDCACAQGYRCGEHEAAP